MGMFQPTPWRRDYGKRGRSNQAVLTVPATRSFTLTVRNSRENPTLVDGVTVSWGLRSTRSGVFVDSGTTLVSSGAINPTVVVASGDYLCNVWLPSDPFKDHNYPVTVS
jgi:hypothetical protein